MLTLSRKAQVMRARREQTEWKQLRRECGRPDEVIVHAAPPLVGLRKPPAGLPDAFDRAALMARIDKCEEEVVATWSRWPTGFESTKPPPRPRRRGLLSRLFSWGWR